MESKMLLTCKLRMLLRQYINVYVLENIVVHYYITRTLIFSPVYYTERVHV